MLLEWVCSQRLAEIALVMLRVSVTGHGACYARASLARLIGVDSTL